MRLVSLVVALCFVNVIQAQNEGSPWKPKWFFGIAEGYHVNSMRFSDLDDDAYDETKIKWSPVVSVFAQAEFGNKQQFAIRPELSYLTRGGKLKDFILDGDMTADYHLKARYFDVRMSFIYNFCKADSKFRPYVFVTPILGFATGGNVSLEASDEDGVYGGVKSDLSDANISKTYFAVAPGGGIKWQFHTGKQGQNLCWLGLEASYELGLTDTYGSKEKDRDANDLLGNTRYNIRGSRKFSGFEVKAVLGIPFSVFSKAKAVEAPQVYVPKPVVEEKAEEKPCYTLEEIIEMMAKNQNVRGKTICAIDAVNFDYGKSSIKSESYDYLDKLAQTIIRTNASIKVKGHTDNIGSDEFNMNLSKERAQAVVDYLVGKGVKRSKLSYEYYGSSAPLMSNETEEGRTMNRRVEFEILK